MSMIMNLLRISKQELENYIQTPSLFEEKLDVLYESEDNDDAFWISIKRGAVFYICLLERHLPLEVLRMK